MLLILITLLVSIHSPAFSQQAKRQRPKQPSGAAREALLASMARLFNAKSFHFEEIQANSAEELGTKVVNTGVYVAPDKYHATTDMNIIGHTGSAEIMVVGEELFLKTSGGQWEKKPVDAKRMKLELAKIRKSGLLENLLKAKDRDVTFVSKVKLDGEAHDLYQFSYIAQLETPAKVRNKIWVRNSDGLPSKVETRFDINQQGLLNFTFNTTTIYSSYNGTIEIKAPI